MITNDVTAICALPADTDIRDKQHNCPDFNGIVEYLKNVSLPDNTVACKIVLESEHDSDQFAVYSEVQSHTERSPCCV